MKEVAINEQMTVEEKALCNLFNLCKTEEDRINAIHWIWDLKPSLSEALSIIITKRNYNVQEYVNQIPANRGSISVRRNISETRTNQRKHRSFSNLGFKLKRVLQKFLWKKSTENYGNYLSVGRLKTN